MLNRAPVGGRGARWGAKCGGIGLKLIGAPEVDADVADRALHPPLLGAAVGGDRPGLEAVVGGAVEEVVVEVDGVALALDDRALEVVVQHDPRHPLEGGERERVAPEEGAGLLVGREPKEDPTRIREDHDEGHQRAGGAVDLDGPEGGPIDLGLFAGERAEAKERLGRRLRPVAPNHGAEVVGGAWVASLANHVVQPTRREGRELLERDDDEVRERVGDRGPARDICLRDASLREHPGHGLVMNAELLRDGARLPLLHVKEAQDLGFDFGGDHRAPVWSRR